MESAIAQRKFWQRASGLKDVKNQQTNTTKDPKVVVSLLQEDERVTMCLMSGALMSSTPRFSLRVSIADEFFNAPALPPLATSTTQNSERSAGTEKKRSAETEKNESCIFAEREKNGFVFKFPARAQHLHSSSQSKLQPPSFRGLHLSALPKESQAELNLMAEVLLGEIVFHVVGVLLPLLKKIYPRFTCNDRR